ncbi:8952_t:CDS:2 [Cetraspora pellucida]|uniref:8952_t:CDS:1 n=1 Tax=Cetraspora pellucida TaxID=1433469 RepID=A0A9N9ES34_9GLOM|nr:8952_t:CDS:2 [Cetraspora pellucida]
MSNSYEENWNEPYNEPCEHYDEPCNKLYYESCDELYNKTQESTNVICLDEPDNNKSSNETTVTNRSFM